MKEHKMTKNQERIILLCEKQRTVREQNELLALLRQEGIGIASSDNPAEALKQKESIK
jgi:hypothetical protein